MGNHILINVYKINRKNSKNVWQNECAMTIMLLINCIHNGLGIAASAKYDCLQPNTKVNMNTVN